MEDDLAITMTDLKDAKGMYVVSNPRRLELFVSDLDNCLDCFNYWNNNEDIYKKKIEGDLFKFTPEKQVEEL